MSSRTYVSTIERGQNSPTFEKIEALATAMKVHPAVLMLLPYLMDEPPAKRLELLNAIAGQIDSCLRGPNRKRVRNSKRP